MPVLILLDMLLLGVEVLLEPEVLTAAAVVLVLLAAIRWRFGAVWAFQTAFLLSIASALFILFQAGSAWGVGLRIYLVPAQLAIWGSWLLVTLGFAAIAR